MLPLAALVAIATSPARGQSNLITFRTDAAQFGRVCQDLAVKSHLKILPDTNLKNEVVLVDVDRVSPKNLVTRLAYVLAAKAELGSDGWRMVPDELARETRRQAALAERIRQIKNAQARLRKSADARPAFDAKKLLAAVRAYGANADGPTRNMTQGQFSVIESIQGASPGHRAAERLAAALPAESLAAMRTGDLLAFSDHPKRFQLPLGEEARTCIEETADEQNQWAAVSPADGQLLSPGRGRIVGDPRASDQTLDPNQARLFVKVTEQGPMMQTIQVMVVGPNGGAVTWVNIDLDLLDAPTTPPTLIKDTTALPALSIRAMQAAAGYYAGRHWETGGASGESRKWVLDPEKYEPLGFVSGEAIDVVARAHRENLVACLPDEAFDATFRLVDESGKVHAKSAAEVLLVLTELGTAVEERDGWLVARPAGDPVRVDRQALAALLQQEDRDGCLRLQPLIDFAGALTENDWGRIAPTLAEAVIPEAVSTADVNDWLPLRLVGMMAADPRENLLSGSTLAADRLGMAVGDLLLKSVYFHQTFGLMVMRGPGAPRPMMAAGGGYPNALNGEPTEAIPDGIDPNSTVAARITPAAFAVDADRLRYGGAIPMSLSTLAMTRATNDHPNSAGGVPVPWEDLGKMRLGHQTTITLRWTLATGFLFQQTMRDNNFDLRSRAVPFADLPDDFRQALDKEITKVMRRPAFGEAGFVRSPAPPP